MKTLMFIAELIYFNQVKSAILNNETNCVDITFFPVTGIEDISVPVEEIEKVDHVVDVKSIDAVLGKLTRWGTMPMFVWKAIMDPTRGKVW